MKKDFIGPIIALSLICLFVSGALAFVNSKTYPVILDHAKERSIDAMNEIIEIAESFIEIHDINGLPRSLTGVYNAVNKNNKIIGYVFMVTTQGYGGEIKLICGINPDGKIIKTATLSQTETKGMATPVFESSHQSQYIGKDKNLNGINAVSGATISSTAYKNGIRDSFAAYEIITGSNSGDHSNE